MPDNLLEGIDINPQMMLGKPVIRGTRITVAISLEKLAAGNSIEEILDDYSRVTREYVLAAVAYAGEALSTDGAFPGSTSEDEVFSQMKASPFLAGSRKRGGIS